MQEWTERILAGDARALARAATLVENRDPEGLALLRELFPRTGKAIISGITGAPGAGKSTLADQLAAAIRAEGATVAIIAVDPTSPFSGGAILGDRVRMQRHHADAGVFIRSMASRGRLGGVAPATTDLAMLLDAAGFDHVLIETVGVGQDEVEVARLADVTAVVLVPGMGDDVQALKAGILEIADLFVINKADRPGVDSLEREIEAMQALGGEANAVRPVVRTVASRGEGIAELLAVLRQCHRQRHSNRRKTDLWVHRLQEMLRERLLEHLPAEEIRQAAEEIADHRSDPYSTVETWLSRLTFAKQEN